MSDHAPPPELIDHLCRQSALTALEAERLIAEVLAYYAENTESFIRRRHRELQAEGISNTTIYSTIRDEILGRRFPANAYTVRQIRRTIYG